MSHENSSSTRELEQYRDDLRRLVSYRLDARVARRLDESDVVQDVLVAAAGELDRWRQDSTKSVFACLYQLARQRISRIHRDHIGTPKRAVDREEHDLGLTDQSVLGLAHSFLGKELSPSENAIKCELRDQTRNALSQLKPTDREILIMRVLEGIPVREVASILEISETAVNVRQLRALQRMRPLLTSLMESRADD